MLYTLTAPVTSQVPELKEHFETRPDAVDCGTAPMLKGKDGEFVRGGDL